MTFIRFLMIACFMCVLGCESGPGTPSDSSRKITWEEFQAMDAEERDDPYVLDNLDDAAKKKLAGKRKR